MAKTHINISYFLALLGFFIGIFEIPELRNLNYSIWSILLSPIAGSYFLWSIYWGQVWFWTTVKNWIGTQGCLIMFIILLPGGFLISMFYGIWGGAIYQYIKHRMLIK